MTTKLGLIRTARWFAARTQDFEGYTLFFVSQFYGTLEKYFDDFTLNGKENLAAIWGNCVGCPTGPNVTARDIVEYIASGQIKTLACYDVAPSLSIGQIYKAADWYEKTQQFQRAIAKGDGNLENKVNAFLKELATPYKEVVSDAMIDTDVAREWRTRTLPNASTRATGSIVAECAADYRPRAPSRDRTLPDQQPTARERRRNAYALCEWREKRAAERRRRRSHQAGQFFLSIRARA
jgi:hypothetical protein